MIALPAPVQKLGELGWLLESVQQHDPRVIVEIGVDQGGTFTMLEEACPEAEMIGIDIGGGKWSSGPPFQDDRVILGDSHSHETLADLRRRLAGRRIDFLFIDGDHSFLGVAEDYWTYTPLVAPHGLVALHDIAIHPVATGVNVADFWRRIRHRHPDAVERIDKPTDWGGIALFAKDAV